MLGIWKKNQAACEGGVLRWSHTSIVSNVAGWISNQQGKKMDLLHSHTVESHLVEYMILIDNWDCGKEY